MNQNRYDEALGVLKGMPSSAARDLRIGIAYAQSGRNDEAKDYLNSALSQHPNLVPAAYTLAMIYEKEKDYGRALGQWNTVLMTARNKKLRELAERHIDLIRELQK
jgi:cytochrome c-type biogenesis protein CcmH/NrfG